MHKTNFIPAAEYDHLCEKDRILLAHITQQFNADLLPDTDDIEAPCNFMYDNKLFCGGWTCVNGENENG